jgi:Xaa-Pro dipeptidase
LSVKKAWKNRVRNIFAKIDSDESIVEKPEAFVLKNGSPSPIAIDPNLYYVSGMGHGLFEDSLLIASRGDDDADGSCKLLVRKSEEMNARENADGVDIVVLGDIVGSHREDYERFLSPYRGKPVGFNFERMSHSDYLNLVKGNNLGAVDISGPLRRARRVKDASEMELLKEACAITSEAFDSVVRFLREGQSELEVAAFVSGEMQRLGASALAFDTICAFGKNGADPHYSPGLARLKKGDFVLMDFGCSVSRYNSDFTRTIVFGSASPTQKEMHRDVLSALDAVTDGCMAGRIGKDVEGLGRRVVERSKFRQNFILGTGGHSIGLSGHDGWDIVPTSEEPLEEDMVVAIEPGVYVPEVGAVRIEDDMVVRKEGERPSLLTEATRELLEV